MEVLEMEMVPTVRVIYPAPLVLDYVQDNSAVHTARWTSDWFDDHPEFVRVQWPP